jgi:hypothetical protein
MRAGIADAHRNSGYNARRNGTVDAMRVGVQALLVPGLQCADSRVINLENFKFISFPLLNF